MLLTIIAPPLRASQPGASARFDATGGTVGRASTNMLVLDDPERTVSRVHAQIVFRDGRFHVVDRGSNPMSHNGRPLGAGNEAPLANGDRLVIGGFELSVSEVGQPAAAAPLGNMGFGGPAPAAMPVSPPTARSNDPFADLLAEFAPKAAPLPAAAPARGAAPLNDPFADLLAPMPSAAPPPAVLPTDFADLAPKAAPSSSSIDALFGLGELDKGADPLGGPLMADPLQPNTASAADPFLSLQSGPLAGAPAASNHVPLLNTAFEVPAPRRAVPPPPEVTAPWPPAPALDAAPLPPIPEPTLAPAAAPAAPALPPDWDPLGGDLLASPAAPVASRVEILTAPEKPAPVVRPAPVPAPAPVAPPVAPPTAIGVPASDAELLAALMRGLGELHKGPQSLTPELMERIGLLLRLSVEGTLQLLVTRQEFKREVKADVTIIASQANNPLKFSPSVEVALDHLLGTGVMRGFMGPTDAMRDAYTDLRAHEFGVMVGIRAALQSVLDRFSPEALEQRLTDKSMLDSLFAANRKAKLWDQFHALSKQIQEEAQEDFHNLFGKAFLKAYDEQVNKLAEQHRQGGPHGR
ncbi:MAG: type VI secretion system-associated FHA domain protein TagH [Hydrogenophaga sp.]|nr:type VI secretion system-associated FHA domain protein TagH [Hydrogenophaga sp.]